MVATYDGNRSALASFLIPDDVRSLGDEAFKDCISLTDIIIPDCVTTIMLILCVMIAFFDG